MGLGLLEFNLIYSNFIDANEKRIILSVFGLIQSNEYNESIKMLRFSQIHVNCLL